MNEPIWYQWNAGGFFHAVPEGPGSTALCGQALPSAGHMDGHTVDGLARIALCRTCRKAAMDRRLIPQPGYYATRTYISDNASVRIPQERRKDQLDPGIKILDRTMVGSDVVMRDAAEISGYAAARDSSMILMNGSLADSARMYRHSVLTGSAVVRGYAELDGICIVTGTALVEGNARISGEARIMRNAHVYGNAMIGAHAGVGEDADVFEADHVVSMTGLTMEPVTLYRTATGHRVQAGCQNFELTDDLLSLANEHSWRLPPQWKTVQNLLMEVAESWH